MTLHVTSVPGHRLLLSAVFLPLSFMCPCVCKTIYVPPVCPVLLTSIWEWPFLVLRKLRMLSFSEIVRDGNGGKERLVEDSYWNHQARISQRESLLLFILLHGKKQTHCSFIFLGRDCPPSAGLVGTLLPLQVGSPTSSKSLFQNIKAPRLAACPIQRSLLYLCSQLHPTVRHLAQADTFDSWRLPFANKTIAIWLCFTAREGGTGLKLGYMQKILQDNGEWKLYKREERVVVVEWTGQWRNSLGFYPGLGFRSVAKPDGNGHRFCFCLGAIHGVLGISSCSVLGPEVGHSRFMRCQGLNLLQQHAKHVPNPLSHLPR